MNEKLQQIQRRSFECWRIYGKRKFDRRRAMHKAIYSYNVRLEQKVINALLRHSIKAKQTRCFYARLWKKPATKSATWTDFNRDRILKKAYRAWFEYSKYRRRIKILNTGIYDLRNQLYLTKYIEIWRIKWVAKKRRLESDKKVDEFYRKFLQRKVLRLWIERHNDKLLQIKEWEVATLHSRLNLLKNIWFAWIKYCNIKIEKANKITDACYFYERQLLRKSFNKLASNVTKRIAERWIIERATNCCEKILLRRIFRGWIDHHRRTIDIARKIEMRFKRVENSTKEKILWQLRLYVWKKKCSRRRNYNSTYHYTRKLKKKIILLWNNYLLYRKEKAIRLLYLNNAVAEISCEIKKMYINRWRMAVICHAQARQKIRSIENYASTRLTKRYFSMWYIYCKRYKIKANRKKILCEIGKSVLLNKYTKLWMKKYAEAAKIYETNENRVMTIFQEKLKSRFFNNWKRYINEKNNKKAENEQVFSLYRKKLLGEGFRKAPKICIHKFESQCENQLDNVKENKFEDLDIKRIFFDKWWRAVVYANDNRQLNRFKMRFKQSNNTYEIPYATNLPHCFVLPEYMIKNTSNFYDTSGFNKRRNLLSRKIRLSSPSESSASGSYDSTDSDSGTYNIVDYFT